MAETVHCWTNRRAAQVAYRYLESQSIPATVKDLASKWYKPRYRYTIEVPDSFLKRTQDLLDQWEGWQGKAS